MSRRAWPPGSSPFTQTSPRVHRCKVDRGYPRTVAGYKAMVGAAAAEVLRLVSRDIDDWRLPAGIVMDKPMPAVAA